MGIVVDLIIIGIIILSTILAYKKGLVAQAIKLCAVIISILISLILYKPVSNFIINTTSIDETIQNAILEKSTSIISQDEENSITSEIIEQAKTGLLPENARELSIQIINILVIIILFIIAKIVLRFVSTIAEKVSKLPIINQFNKIGGIIYGLIRGLLIVYICLLLINFASQINPNNAIHTSINQSSIGKTMYQNNVLNILF